MEFTNGILRAGSGTGRTMTRATSLRFFGSQRSKAIVTYDGGDVNGIHHTGGICHRGGC